MAAVNGSVFHMLFEHQESADIFEGARPRLWGLAYRMLGSAADAEDAVQDTYLRWQSADRKQIETPEAWLTTICTRRCIDMLRAAHRSRVDYVGPWLPEPIVGIHEQETSHQAELASSLSTAFLLLLERLTPTERAAYLLREVFDYDYQEVAGVLDKNLDTCRKLVSRAKKHVGGDKTRFTPQPDQQERLLNEFLGAVRTGAVDRLEALLAEDVELWADGGGKAIAAKQVVQGAGKVARFLSEVWQVAWNRYDIMAAEVNGSPGLIFRESGETVGVLSFAATPDNRISGFFVVRNPDKLHEI